MNRPILNKLFLFSSIVGVLIAVLHFFNLVGDYPDFVWISWAFFSLITALVLHTASLYRTMKSPRSVVNVILSAMMMKFMLSLFLILIYFFVSKPPTAYFVLPFFVLYTIFTVWETGELVKMTK